MRRRLGLYVSTAFYIFTMLFMRFLWLPYTGEMTLEGLFHLVRWVFYLIAIGAANLFFYMTLTGFWNRFVPGLLIPIGLRMLLDGLIYLSARYLGAWSYTARYVLDAVYIVLAGLSITWIDRTYKKRERRKPTRAEWIAVGIALGTILCMIVIVQWDALRIAQKYVLDSEGYKESLLYVAMKAYLFSLAISFIIQMGVVFFVIDRGQSPRLRQRGFINCVALMLLLGVASLLYWHLYPAYFWSSQNESNMKAAVFTDDQETWNIAFEERRHRSSTNRVGREHRETMETDGWTSEIYDREHANSIRFTASEAWYVNKLQVNGYTAYYYSPYALFYYDGSAQQMMLYKDICNRPQDAVLIEVLKAGILDNDFHCFEYGAAYLIKYAPEFIAPYIERFSQGAFTEQELAQMGSIRPDYVQSVARRLASPR